MSGEIDRNDIEHQVRARRVEAVAASREIGEWRAGVDTLIPSGKRIGECAFNYRGTNHSDSKIVAFRKYQLLAEALGVAVGVGPAPAEGTRFTDFLEALLDPPLAAPIGYRRRLATWEFLVA